MKFLAVARVLVANQIKAYRVHKFLVVFDLLIALSVLPIFLLPGSGEVVVELYRALTGVVSLRTLKVLLASVISAFVFLTSATRRGALVVVKEHYPILLHPVSLRDFLIGRIASEVFALLKLSLVTFAIFFSLSYISGGIFSAVLAFFVFIFGIAYLSAVATALSLLGLRYVLFALSVLSLVDAVTGNVTASYLAYVVIDTIHSCYTSPNLLPFIAMFFLSFLFLSLVSERVSVDVELIQYAPKREVRSERISGTLKKLFLEFRRSKVVYAPLFAIPSFFAGKVFASYLPRNLSDFAMMYSVIVAVSFMEFHAMREASTLWFYRVNSAVGEFAKSVVLKAFLSGAFALTPIFAFFLPLGLSLQTAFVSASLLAALSPFVALLSVRLVSRSRVSVRYSGMHESRAVEQSVTSLYFILFIVVASLLVALLSFAKQLAPIVLATIPAGVKVVEKYAEGVDVR